MGRGARRRFRGVRGCRRGRRRVERQGELCARQALLMSTQLYVGGKLHETTIQFDLGRRRSGEARACARILSISSGPWMPSGKPGKFSTSVVPISCPPGTPPFLTPSNTWNAGRTRGQRRPRSTWRESTFPNAGALPGRRDVSGTLPEACEHAHQRLQVRAASIDGCSVSSWPRPNDDDVLDGCAVGQGDDCERRWRTSESQEGPLGEQLPSSAMRNIPSAQPLRDQQQLRDSSALSCILIQLQQAAAGC